MQAQFRALFAQALTKLAAYDQLKRRTLIQRELRLSVSALQAA